MVLFNISPHFELMCFCFLSITTISCVKTDSDTKRFIYVHNRFCSWCLVSNIPQVMNWRDRTRMIPLLAFLKPGLDRVYQIDAVENLTYSFRAQDKSSIIWRWIDFIRLQREDLTWDIRLDYYLLPVDVICCIVYLFIYLFIIYFHILSLVSMVWFQ